MSDQATLEGMVDSKSNESETSRDSDEKYTSLDKTSVGNPPEDWKNLRLRDISGDTLYGASESAEAFDPKKPRYLRVTDLSKDRNSIKDKDPKSISKDKVGKYMLEKGDMLFARSGSVGKTFYYNGSDEEYAYGGYLIKFPLVNDSVNPYYLQSYTHSPLYWKWVKRITRTGAQPNINAQEYSDILVPIPPKPEQRRIASVLHNIDQAISKTEEIINQTQRVKKGLMQDLLIGENADNKKEIEIGPQTVEIPEEWEKRSLESLLEIQTGDYFKKKNFVDEGIRCLKIDNVGFGRIFWETETYLPESYLEKHEDLALEEGDLLMAMNRPIVQNEVKVGLVQDSDTPSILYQRVGRFFTNEEVENKFLKYALRGPLFKRELKRRLSGTNQPYVNNSDIYSIELPLPPYEVQKEISETLSVLDNKIKIDREQKERLKKLKKGLMQDLFTGEIRTNEKVEVLDEVIEVEG